MAALLAMTAGAARQMPLLMIVEDAHWIDPTSLDLTTRMIERMRDLPIMMVITCRPEFTSPWSGDNVTTRHVEPARPAASGSDGRSHDGR